MSPHFLYIDWLEGREIFLKPSVLTFNIKNLLLETLCAYLSSYTNQHWFSISTIIYEAGRQLLNLCFCGCVCRSVGMQVSLWGEWYKCLNRQADLTSLWNPFECTHPTWKRFLLETLPESQTGRVRKSPVCRSPPGQSLPSSRCPRFRIDLKNNNKSLDSGERMPYPFHEVGKVTPTFPTQQSAENSTKWYLAEFSFPISSSHCSCTTGGKLTKY